MATITRSDFAERLRERFGLTPADAYKMVDVVFDDSSLVVSRADVFVFT